MVRKKQKARLPLAQACPHQRLLSHLNAGNSPTSRPNHAMMVPVACRPSPVFCAAVQTEAADWDAINMASLLTPSIAGRLQEGKPQARGPGDSTANPRILFPLAESSPSFLVFLTKNRGRSFH
jgi:hypothetical protein